MKLSDHPLDALNSLFSSFLVTLFTCSFTTLPDIGSFFWLSHLQTTPISDLALVCHSLRVFPLLNFATFFLFLFFFFCCKLVYCTCLSHFHLCVEINHHAFLWRPWLQLNIQVKFFGYFTIHGMVFLFCWESTVHQQV